jgi:prepilin-type N-terminal cleavage/methylation domain-containing protein
MHRLNAWVKTNLRGKKGQRGFTLIELLVVVTILGILAGIVTLSLVGLTTHSNTEACNSEYKVVQAALDAYMANNNYLVLPNGAQSGFTNDMTGGAGGNVALYVASPSSTSPNYTRNGTTQFFYTWDQFGRVNGIGSNGAGGPVQGCAPK